MALTFASGSRAVAHSTASDAVHNAVHCAFMTLPAYSRSREDGENKGHEPGFGVGNGSYTARSRPVEASRERMEREGPDPSAQGTARCVSRGKSERHDRESSCHVSSLGAARWNKEEAMERRKFLGALTGASLSVPLEGSSAERAGAQHPTASSARVARQSSFAPSQVEVAGNTVFVRRYGTGPAILLVHGFPRTSLIWRFLAPRLAENHTVICVDLRAYGRSGIPASTDNHFPYSKRAMAEELVAVMVTLGFPTFTLIGHDRGGRVCYRMALDHPKHVERLAVLDVIPILEGWSRADARFAQTYWPWILLAQEQPLPESYLLGAPKAVFENPFGHGSFGPEILEEYLSTYRDPARVHGICEEYRAAATIDVEHDRADKEASRRIECPMLHLWAEGGPLDTFYAKDGGPLGIWRQWAPHVHGQAMKGGHFFPEVVNSLKGGPILHRRVGICTEGWKSGLRLQAMPPPLRLLPSISCK